MRRCCEETLRVLRCEKESLLTIMGVFIHDPLFRWALTPHKANRRQHVEGEEGGEEMAEVRATSIHPLLQLSCLGERGRTCTDSAVNGAPWIMLAR